MTNLIALLFLMFWSAALVYAVHRKRRPSNVTLFSIGAALALTVITASNVAHADTGAGSSVVGGDVRGGFVDVIMAQLVAGLGLGLKWLWNKVSHSRTAQKVISFTQQHQLAQQLGQAGVDYATEIKHQAISEGRKIVSSVLESSAVDHALDLLRKAKLPPAVEKMIREEMTKIVLSRLGASRPRTTPRPLATVG